MFEKPGPLPAKPAFADKGVQTKIHDIHNHSIGPGYAPSQIKDLTKTLTENVLDQIKLFDQAGVDKFVWAPIPTIIIEGKAVTCCGTEDPEVDKAMTLGKTYYMDETHRGGAIVSADAFKKITTEGKQYYNTSVDWQVGKAYNELRVSHPEIAKRIFPSITGINLGDANSVSAILRLKKEYPDTFFISGEITMHKEFVDKQNLDYSPEFDEKAPINDLMRFYARAGMPLSLHCDTSDAEIAIGKQKPEEGAAPGGGEYFEKFRAFVQRHPDTQMRHAHFAGEGKFASPAPQGIAEIRKLLETCPNYGVDISWDVVAEHYSPHSNITGRPEAKAADESRRRELIKAMAQLINDYPDRFIMGSDSLVARGPQSISATYGHYSNLGQGSKTLEKDSQGREKVALFDALHPDTLVKVLSTNFEVLLDTARIKGREYEKNGMVADLAKLQNAAELAGRTPNDWGY